MKKNMNKKGFTLVETIVVVAIITIVTGVTIVSIGDSYQRYQNAADAASERQFPQVMQLTKDNILDARNNNRVYIAIQGSGDSYEHGDEGGTNNGGGNVLPTPSESSATSSEQTTASSEQTTASTSESTTATTSESTTASTSESSTGTTSTAAPEPTTTTQPAGNGGSGGISSARMVGGTGNGVGNGVSSLNDNHDGSYSASLVYRDWETAQVTIWDNGDGTYDLRIDNGQNAIGGVIGYNSNSHYCSSGYRFTLSDNDMSRLSSTYGFTFGS